MKSLKTNNNRRRRQSGFTLVEILVATTIMVISLMGVAVGVNSGLIQLKDAQIDRAASQCASAVMEMLMTIPAEQVYAEHGSEGDWATFPAINSFIASRNTICSELASGGTPLGQQVQLSYEICPGCVAYTSIDEETSMETNTCTYSIRLRLCYNRLSSGDDHCIQHYRVSTPATSDNCADVCGTAPASPGTPAELAKNCPD